MKKISATITIQNKKYEYSLEDRGSNLVYVICKEANISQEFLAEDIARLLIDLPSLITAEKEYKNNHSEIIRFRISSEDKNKIEKKAIKKGYNSVSEYMRALALG
jgi:hypothetical protein